MKLNKIVSTWFRGSLILFLLLNLCYFGALMFKLSDRVTINNIFITPFYIIIGAMFLLLIIKFVIGED